MTLPTTKVEIAFSTQPDDPSPVWVDVTSYVRAFTGITITRGRQDQYDTVQPSRLSLTLLNVDGRFTPGNVSSPYYPNVKKGRKIRVSQTWASVTYYRFTGYVDEWPVTWADASATLADSAITASSRMARLGRGRILPSIIETEVLYDGAVAYYPLGDAVDTSNAGNVSTTVQPQLAVTPFGGGGTGNISFGNDTGPPTDDLTCALFTRVSGTAGAYLGMTSPSALAGVGDGCLLLECFFLTFAAQEMGVASVDGVTSGTDFVALGLNSSGKLTGILSQYGSPIYTLTSAATVSDGLTHHAAIRQTQSGGSFTAELFLDGTQVASTSIANWDMSAMYRVLGGGGLANSAYAGNLSHVAVTWAASQISSTRIQQHYLAGSTGFSGETSDQRIERLARYAAVPTAELSTETGLSTSIANQFTNGKTALSLMQDVTSTEGGVLFDSGDGSLVFHARSHRYNASSALTLNAAGGELQASFEARLDDQQLVNDITASRPNGVSLRAVDTASVDEYGTYREDIELLTTDDNEVSDAASWRVYTASTLQVRIPTAEVDVGRPASATKTAILAREIGDRITLAGLPSQAPVSSMDSFIEGWTETITVDTYRITFNLSSAALFGVWQLDSSAYSILNTTTRLGY